jgi:hypothetical protein
MPAGAKFLGGYVDALVMWRPQECHDILMFTAKEDLDSAEGRGWTPHNHDRHTTAKGVG